jgi:stress-induced-phosphoprotein 1
MADALKNKGNEAFQRKDYVEAVKLFTEAIQLDPKNHVLYSNRSGAYAAQQKYTEALEDAEQTIKIKPDWAKVR